LEGRRECDKCFRVAQRETREKQTGVLGQFKEPVAKITGRGKSLTLTMKCNDGFARAAHFKTEIEKHFHNKRECPWQKKRKCGKIQKSRFNRRKSREDNKYTAGTKIRTYQLGKEKSKHNDSLDLGSRQYSKKKYYYMFRVKEKGRNCLRHF